MAQMFFFLTLPKNQANIKLDLCVKVQKKTNFPMDLLY
jgi:hypothetical protein